MVQKGYLRIHKRHDFCENISKIVSDDVIEELEKRNCNDSSRIRTSGKFLKIVDALNVSLPHRNKAAKNARKSVFAMQTHYDSPNIFFTVSPSDDNSLIMTLYGKNDVDLNSKDIFNDVRGY